ncbi:P-loop NTPase [Lachnobacterium bovis]|uniref:Flagellar biosynthesis protein FlhG n=1 Tax=Lachnobacterium bovis DSM 14045 TaxID=1122142 RepID=A0A1H3EZ10_9FIRM|nr:P-loop NTPase [Lachnobacterium bovis]MBQ1802616.1 P-loop NTPase [Lachnobacterium sp.]SDX83825.1 flagellar biosynthesis protein FlhG [Lachnobacterium bovis DSM 14045]
MDQAQQLREAINHKKQNAPLKKVARVLAVTSGKGGVGKSNISVNLAVVLQKLGKKVIIFDADFGLANVEVMFGSKPEYTLSDLIYRGMSIREIINIGPHGIGFISGGSGIIGLNNLGRNQILYMVKSLEDLNEMADYIIIDTGAGISNQVVEFLKFSPEVLLVTTPDPSSIADSYSLLKALYKNPGYIKGHTKIHVIANKVVSKEEGNGVFSKLSSVVTNFLDEEIDYYGMIPADVQLEKAVKQQKIVSEVNANAKSSKAFRELANKLIDKEDVTDRTKKFGISQLFSEILNNKL